MRSSLLIVLFTVMINMMGVGMAWPILPLLVRELTGGSISQVATIYGATAIIFSLMQFIVSPLMGILSDRFGRKPVMLVALAALGFDNILLALAPTISWMFFGRLIGGAFASTMAIANAFVADTTKPDKRAKGFGLIGAAFGIGFVIGPLVGGILGEIDLRLPFWFAAFLSFANVGFGWFLLKETLPRENRRKRSLRQSNPVSSIHWMFTTTGLAAIGAITLISSTMQRGLESLWVLFTQHQYGWGMQDAGFSLAIVGVSFIIVQGFLAGRIIPWLGEIRTIIYGSLLSASMFFLLAFNTLGILGYLGIIPHVLGWALASTAMQTLASKQVNASEQGYLQGALSGIAGLAAIVGPLLSNSSFAWFTSTGSAFIFPGAYFLFGGIMLVANSFIAARTVKAN
ncbi:MAG: TCR/Tet family MFS transporter [Hyphomicrobiales bacterium]|nr:TCR/Tet family MFS transporter [Hyphomicrobiales bacterium]